MLSPDQLRSCQDTPDPLKKLCLKRIISSPVKFSRYTLPPELGSSIAIAFRDHAITNRFAGNICERFFKRFKHRHLPLKKINFSNLPIREQVVLDFIREYQDQLEEIDVTNCREFELKDFKSFNQILKKTSNPKSLIIGESSRGQLSMCTEKLFDDDLKLKKLVVHKVLPCHEGQKLTIDEIPFLPSALRSTLRYLDLSSSRVGSGSAFKQLESLEILILYNCNIHSYFELVDAISNLSKLYMLDLSKQVTDLDELIPASEEPRALDHIVSRLPNLKRLDISGTDLIGGKDRHIAVFEERMSRPFEFLGLFHTGSDAAYRSCIPAVLVAGEANETQILVACEAYMKRPKQLEKAVNDLYNLYKTITPSEPFGNINQALDVLLKILTEHISDEQVMIYATAALWCIVKINVTTKNLNDIKVRRTITSKLLDVMLYQDNRVILINGSLTLIFLSDIICEHSRVAAISLMMCRNEDARTQGFGVNLLNTLACQAGGDQKVYIGELSAIETMLDIINARITDDICDETLEYAWSTLWNITDETPKNCERFLNNDGLEIFESCMDKFGNNKEVLRNIMGLLGNVAECQSLRVHFMKRRYIRRFHSLLSTHIDGIECCYNACGILAHLVSNGREYWERHLSTDPDCNLDDILHEMKTAISQWPINSARNINYKSFEPIVRLLDKRVAPQAQYWAVFALTNLTRLNPSKYCPLLLPHNGLQRLHELTLPGVTEQYVRNLAIITLYQYERFQNEGSLSGLEQCASIDLQVVQSFRIDPNQADSSSDMNEMIVC